MGRSGGTCHVHGTSQKKGNMPFRLIGINFTAIIIVVPDGPWYSG
jgi:hypothetical protein